MSTSKTFPCPQCGQPVDMTTHNAYRPFCSRRCKLIDLGGWLDESNRIPDPDNTADPSSLQRSFYGDDESTH